MHLARTNDAYCVMVICLLATRLPFTYAWTADLLLDTGLLLGVTVRIPDDTETVRRYALTDHVTPVSRCPLW